MGIIVSRFRKKKTSEELLEDIQKNIEKLENDSKFILKREKAILFRLIFFSVLIYIIAALLFYFYFFPASLWDRLFYMIPLLIFPIIIIVVRRSIKWLYDRDMRNSSNKLKDLQTKKKEILDDVMNTETYKKAKEILDKYAPEQLRKSPAPSPLQSTLTQINRTPPNKKPETNVQQSNHPSSVLQQRVVASTPLRSTPPGLKPIPPARRPLPRPLLPQDRSYLDKIIEIIVGDGPSNRYALICKFCSSHNGMALKEEFEYLSFRCAYCGTPNPSLKVRPREVPPRFTPLQLPGPIQPSNDVDDQKQPSTEDSDVSSDNQNNLKEEEGSEPTTSLDKENSNENFVKQEEYDKEVQNSEQTKKTQ
ncbi:endoplasmic reticulum junction formation protein lunapark-B isoform X1 [Cimex lectularius]|uniref:Endoplasmic reticulum junction formation protein lunapark n=1 Tax=Cimex lectularius TaxID=79782 RepID=A0A8I6RIH3_CIMLE|nr:endoplasmic reticulum junction formation protein lunapark-B isoform X1 [Cimex lectularius]XP_014245979.1 endoplasmic reticulum junction formation protein lunapark-B isoform X1 [Cimex lectularius]